MFEKILVCVDPYPANQHLVSAAISLIRSGAEEVVLAHVIAASPSVLDRLLIDQARPEMERQKRTLEEAGLQVSIEMLTGYPARALNDLAEKKDVSVIIVGTHGRGLFESMTLAGSALGNVSAKLLQIASRPVLLIRTAKMKAETAKAPVDLFSHILFPTDFSDTAEIALAYLETLVRTRHCPVTLLHVREEARRSVHYPDTTLPDWRKLDDARLQRVKLWLEHVGSPMVDVKLVQGKPGDEIVKHAGTKDCSLILMGTQGKGITREMLLGSVAHDVARHAEQPVIFIPAVQPPGPNR